MSVLDILARVDAICKKYDKYDVKKQRANANVFGDDKFVRLYFSVEADIEDALVKAELVSHEKNRAATVALNAEIRRIKTRLMEEVPKLQRLTLKKVKQLSNDELATRYDLVLALPERIQSIPDGTAIATEQGGGWGALASRTGISFDSTSDGKFDSEYFQQTEESNQFIQEYETRKMKQDQDLDAIAEGLYMLKKMAYDMNEVDKAYADTKNTNVRLKDTLNQVVDFSIQQGGDGVIIQQSQRRAKRINLSYIEKED